MKKLAIVGLAVCAMTITSCAPSISREEALVKAEQIRETIENSGEYPAGSKFELNYTINQSLESYGAKNGTNQKGTISIDLTQNYVRSHLESTTFITVFGEDLSETEVTDIWAYMKDEKVYLGTKVTLEGEVKQNDVYEYALEDEAVEYLNSTVADIYSVVTNIFRNSVTSIFKYLNTLINDDMLKAAGITLGSNGEGSLIIKENVNVSANGVTQKSFALIEFEDYLLKTMKADIKLSDSQSTKLQFVEYNFKYNTCKITY